MQTSCAGAHGYGVIYTVIQGVIRSQRRFKGCQFGAQAEVRRAQNCRNGIDLGLGDVGRGEWDARVHLSSA
jgi:hypothetical protein